MSPDTMTIEKLDEILAETFESMVFMEILPQGSSDPDQDPDSYWASVALEEPSEGLVGLRCGTDLLRDLVSAVFGEIVSDEELESRGADLLAELANTVAGRLAGAIGNEGAQVRVGLPERGRGDFEGVGQPLAYQLDDGRRFEVLLQLTDG
jgi:hypothetical protein